MGAGIRQGSYGHLQTSAAGDLNADGKAEFVTMNGDSVITFKNTTTGGIVSFKFDTIWVLPLNISSAGNYTLNCMIYDIDRDGAPDFMTHYRSAPGDSNFIFFVHHKTNPDKIGWDSTSVFHFRHKPYTTTSPDMGAAYLYAPFCDKPDLISLFDAAESGKTNTFYYFQNISTPGHIKFDTGACIVNNSSADVMAYDDFNHSGIQSYVTYQDGNAITIVTDTVKVKITNTGGGGNTKLSGFIDTTICEGQYVPIHLHGGVSYKWTPALYLDTLSAGNNFSVVLAKPTKSVHYHILVKIGCNAFSSSTGGGGYNTSDTGNINIIVLPKPSYVKAGTSFRSIYGSTYNFPDATTDGKYHIWLHSPYITDSLNLHPTTLPLLDTAVFVLMAYDTLQCPIFDTMTIMIDNKSVVMFPTAFTPNHDGVNDEFMPHFDNIASVHWVVYSRWGQELFETHSMTGYWNGNFNGQPEPVGTYVYFGEAVSKLTGRTIKFKGSVQLLH